MAYTIHITKKKNWTDEEPKISQKEWDTLKANGTLESVSDKSMNAWDARRGDVYFSFYSGDIVCNPRKEKDIEKIKEVASLLNAKVQGDDGEIY